MTRLLVSIGALTLVGAGLFLLTELQQCAATSDIGSANIASESVCLVATEASADVSPFQPVDTLTAVSPLSAKQPSGDFIVQNDDAFAPPPTSAAKSSTKRTIRVPRTVTVFEDRVIELPETTPLQQQYSVLMLKRAQRMSDDELKSAIAELEQELQEQDEAADTELKKAVEILEQLKEGSGGTPAAGRAAEALPILKATKPATKPATTLFPQPSY